MLGFRLQALSVGVLGLALVAAVAATVEQVDPSSAGLFTTEQAERGEVVYEEKCASCHGGIRDITPGMAALLADRAFRSGWTGRPLGELFGMVRETMPQDDPGTLSDDQTADLVAYILSGNRFSAGETALTNDIDALMEILFEP